MGGGIKSPSLKKWRVERKGRVDQNEAGTLGKYSPY